MRARNHTAMIVGSTDMAHATRNKAHTLNAERFLAKNPSFLGSHNGADYYEHPTYGDDEPMHCIDTDGEVYRSDFYDMDSVIN